MLIINLTEWLDSDFAKSLISLVHFFVQLGALEEDPDNGNKDELSEKNRHQLKHRELFLSRQVETLPATHIRGKCTVTLLNETESLLSYLNKDVSTVYFVYCKRLWLFKFAHPDWISMYIYV